MGITLAAIHRRRMTRQNDLFKPDSDRSEIRQYATKTQGAEANHKGIELEKQVRTMFVGRGAIVVPYNKYIRKTEDFFDNRTIVPQFPYSSLVGQESRADLVYFHTPGKPGVGIECKVQDGSGSADEKLVVMYFNAMKWKFAERAWFIVSGDGFRKQYVHWLKYRASIEYPGKPIRVFTSIDSLRVAVRDLVERGNPMGGA